MQLMDFQIKMTRSFELKWIICSIFRALISSVFGPYKIRGFP